MEEAIAYVTDAAFWHGNACGGYTKWKIGGVQLGQNCIKSKII